MNILYQQSSLGLSISFRLVHLELLSTNPTSLGPCEPDGDKYLTSFCKYAGKKNKDGHLWDHGILLSGVDLKINGSDDLLGIAPLAGMCFKPYSCSLSEGTSFSTAFVLAHEVAHSLGIEHDGGTENKNCDSKKYIMSPTSGAGKINWSSCSANNIKTFVAKGKTNLLYLKKHFH